MTWLLRFATALAPLAVTPLLLYGIADGYLNFGGGEKDLILLVPWVFWSLVFAITALILWGRRWPHRRALTRSAVVAFCAVAVVLVGLAVMSVAGVGGR